MYLVTTMQCNLACKYCVVLGNEESNQNHEQNMSLDVGLAAIKLFERLLKQNKQKSSRVTFYGGEPLINKELMFALIPKIREMELSKVANPVDIVVITNGIIYDPELTELFKEYVVDVAISIDGEKKHHDLARVDSNNNGSFERVISTLKKYQDAGLSVNITTTIGKHNVENLPEIAKFFAKEFNVKFVEFQIPCQIPGDSNSYWVSSTEFSKYLMQAYEVLKDLNAVEATTYRRLRNFANGVLRLKDCGASGSQLVVAPDGSLGPCHSLVGSKTYFSGNVLDSNCDPTIQGNFVEWGNRYPLNMTMCHKCPFISLCGGGCIYNSYLDTGSIWNKDPQVCSYMKEMVEWILQDLWKKAKNAI